MISKWISRRKGVPANFERRFKKGEEITLPGRICYIEAFKYHSNERKGYIASATKNSGKKNYFLKQLCDWNEKNRVKYFIREIDNLSLLCLSRQDRDRRSYIPRLRAASVDISNFYGNPEYRTNRGYRNQVKKRITEEAKLLAKNKQPLLILTDFIHGETLDKYAEKMRLDEIILAFMNICSVVNFLHENQTIHRDLKPQNIMIRQSRIEPKEPILLDLDGARKIEEIRVKCLNCGKKKSIIHNICTNCGKPLPIKCPNCMTLNERDRTYCKKCSLHLPIPSEVTNLFTHGWEAPEQRKRFEGVSEKTDIYALGTILYYWLTTKKRGPILDTDKKELYKYQLKLERYRGLAGIPDHTYDVLAGVVRKATDPYPSNRYATINDLLLQLNPVLVGLLRSGRYSMKVSDREIHPSDTRNFSIRRWLFSKKTYRRQTHNLKMFDKKFWYEIGENVKNINLGNPNSESTSNINFYLMIKEYPVHETKYPMGRFYYIKSNFSGEPIFLYRERKSTLTRKYRASPDLKRKLQKQGQLKMLTKQRMLKNHELELILKPGELLLLKDNDLIRIGKYWIQLVRMQKSDRLIIVTRI
jgi:serine/threonine protein kinase